MPSPIAHLSVGYAIYGHYQNTLPKGSSKVWKLSLQMIIVMGLSMLPDLDVVPAILFRNMRGYHNNISHSFLFAIPVAFLIAGIFHPVYGSSYWLWFLICLISYDLHVFMDALIAERGVMMFWPLTERRYTSPIQIFLGLKWGQGWFSIWHLWTILTESIFGLVVLLATSSFDQRRNQKNAGSHHRGRKILE